MCSRSGGRINEPPGRRVARAAPGSSRGRRGTGAPPAVGYRPGSAQTQPGALRGSSRERGGGFQARRFNWAALKTSLESLGEGKGVKTIRSDQGEAPPAGRAKAPDGLGFHHRNKSLGGRRPPPRAMERHFLPQSQLGDGVAELGGSLAPCAVSEQLPFGAPSPPTGLIRRGPAGLPITLKGPG